LLRFIDGYPLLNDFSCEWPGLGSGGRRRPKYQKRGDAKSDNEEDSQREAIQQKIREHLEANCNLFSLNLDPSIPRDELSVDDTSILGQSLFFAYRGHAGRDDSRNGVLTAQEKSLGCFYDAK